MIKYIVALAMLSLMVCEPVFARQKPNYGINEYVIAGFKADSLKYTPWFNIADSSYVHVQISFDDTSSAGYGSDSVYAIYFMQSGYPCYSSAGALDTFINPSSMLIDTIQTIVAANWKVAAYTNIGTDGIFADSAKALDSVSVSGFGVTGRQIAPRWSPIARIGIKGQSGNNVDGVIKLRVTVTQGVAIPTMETR